MRVILYTFQRKVEDTRERQYLTYSYYQRHVIGLESGVNDAQSTASAVQIRIFVHTSVLKVEGKVGFKDFNGIKQENSEYR